MKSTVLDDKNKLALKLRNLGGTEFWVQSVIEAFEKIVNKQTLNDNEIEILNTVFMQLPPNGN